MFPPKRLVTPASLTSAMDGLRHESGRDRASARLFEQGELFGSKGEAEVVADPHVEPGRDAARAKFRARSSR